MPDSLDQQPIVRTVGRRRERELSLKARGDLLHEGAVFVTEMAKIRSCLRFPQGLYRYKTHEEADAHWQDCLADNIARVSGKRHGG